VPSRTRADPLLASQLAENGRVRGLTPILGYLLERVRRCMFSHTPHVEAVALLSRA